MSAALVAMLAAFFTALAACGGGSDNGNAEPDEQFLPPEPPSGYTPKTIAYADRDMVAAANPLAVDAGVQVLRDGGSAVDAAIAVQLVLNLVEPQSSGIGGGAFMLHFDNDDGALVAYDGRETAPAAATPELFLDAQGEPLPFLSAVDGGRSVGTPGLLRLLEAAHREHGKRPWASLFEPAIRLAEDGFEISPRLNVSIAASADRIEAQGEPVASYFLQADGTAKPAGTLLKNPAFAATLRSIAAGGADAFYGGTLAQAIVDKVRNHPTNPGGLTAADLAAYRVVERDAVCGSYRVTYRICGMPAPSSGGITVLQTLGILERFDLARTGPNSLDSVHLISEAYRLAYADRAVYIADPAFYDVPTAGLLNADYLTSRAAMIDLQRSMGVPSAGQPPGAAAPQGADRSLSLPSTSHMSLIDGDGNAVSMTTTIENGFGSLQMVGGFLLNNELTDFSFLPEDEQGRPIANRVQPGKRPRSSMAPVIVFNGDEQVEAIIGSPGGSAIIQYVTKSLIGMIDWKLNVQQAINLPNFGAMTTATTSLEDGSVLEGLQAGLEARGHTVLLSTAFTSGLHGIVYNGRRAGGVAGQLARNPNAGTYAGGADPRREGVAEGNDD